jgi:outer membrane protein assembly factor BamD
MGQSLRYILFSLFFSGFMVSCKTSYNSVLKSDDIGLKYRKAEEYYAKKDYNKALPLLEDLLNYYRGTVQAEKVYWMLSNTYYQLKDYQIASFQFSNFVLGYPLSEHAEEASFLNAYCLYLDSPNKDLDQTNTKSAINAFKNFADRYPESSRIEETNRYIDELSKRLEEKAVENARLYYQIEDYKAAIWAIRDVLSQYPATKDREELEFLIVKSAYLLAENSIRQKQVERYSSTLQYYLEFKERFPQSKYDGEASRIYKDANEQIEKLKASKS